MNDMDLERALGNRAQQVPSPADAADRALESLGLSQKASTVRHFLNLVVAVAPVLVSCIAIYVSRKDAILAFGTRASQVMPELLRQFAATWQQFSTGLEPSLALSFGTMAIAFCLVGSWFAGYSYYNQSMGD